MKRFLQSAALMFLAADSVLLMLFGRRWVRFTRFGPPSSDYFRLMTRFLTWPEWTLRAFGALEGALALVLFKKWEPPQRHGSR